MESGPFQPKERTGHPVTGLLRFAPRWRREWRLKRVAGFLVEGRHLVLDVQKGDLPRRAFLHDHKGIDFAVGRDSGAVVEGDFIRPVRTGHDHGGVRGQEANVIDLVLRAGMVLVDVLERPIP